MHPVLIAIGKFRIYTYGFMVATGMLVGMVLLRRQARREGVNPDKILDVAFYVLVSALIGSRLLFVLMNVQEYIHEPMRALKIWDGGLVFYGGLLPAIAIGLWYIRRAGLPLWQVTDIFAPSVAIGHAIGRIGCFGAGCCYGTVSSLPWAVTFTDPRCLAPLDVTLHPVQLYSSLSLFLIFIILILLRRRKSFHGEIFCSYIALYSVARFFMEFLRGDYRGNIFGGLISITQGISVLLAGISVALWLYLRKRRL